MKQGGKFTMSSDAHMIRSLGADDRIQEVIRTQSIDMQYILNTSLDSVLEHIASRKLFKK
jgi:histidinol phosphatase-like PHP family hydrolase